jgi:hypothetical protein
LPDLTPNYDGGTESLLNPKLTNHLKSENFPLFWSPFAPVAALSPVDGALAFSPPALGRGSDNIPIFGLVMFTAARWEEAEGSMSREKRKEVLAS